METTKNSSKKNQTNPSKSPAPKKTTATRKKTSGNPKNAAQKKTTKTINTKTSATTQQNTTTQPKVNRRSSSKKKTATAPKSTASSKKTANQSETTNFQAKTKPKVRKVNEAVSQNRQNTKSVARLMLYVFIGLVVMGGGITLLTSNTKRPQLLRTEAEVLEDKKGKSLFYERYSKLFGVNFTGYENKQMLKMLHSWRGVPYVYGGTTSDGTDCSGFVYLMYWNTFKVHLNRTSRGLINDVFIIDQTELEFGDLVFFRQKGKEISHVGIYLGDRKFIHSSINRGVVINSLDDRLYKKMFYVAGRVKTGKKLRFKDLFAI